MWKINNKLNCFDELYIYLLILCSFVLSLHFNFHFSREFFECVAKLLIGDGFHVIINFHQNSAGQFGIEESAIFHRQIPQIQCESECSFDGDVRVSRQLQK